MAIEIGYWTKNILLFSLHVGIWTLWTLLIRASQPDNSGYPYDVVTVVFLTEFTKFTLSALFHFYPYDGGAVTMQASTPARSLAYHVAHGLVSYSVYSIPVTQWGREASNILGQFSMGVYFAVPAFVYTMYNSLFFLNLVFFDPVSYRVLINIRIVWSGLLYQFFFNQRLGLKKWSALGLLTLGCAVNQMSPEFKLVTSPLYLAAIGFQAFTSSFGGAYSEVLLKKVRHGTTMAIILSPSRSCSCSCLPVPSHASCRTLTSRSTSRTCTCMPSPCSSMASSSSRTSRTC